MSHVDSEDDAAGRILRPEKADDSKESSKNNERKTWKEIDENGTEWETNDEETPDTEW